MVSIDSPRNAWYPVATSDEVGRVPFAGRLLDQRVVLYRTSVGKAVALADRCLHRPVPLSDGRLDGDDIIVAYTGFRYGPDGRCLAVPTQAHVPFGAAVRCYPVHEDGTFVWVWAGEPRLAALRTPPDTAWMRAPEWVTFGDAHETAASITLLRDNFADITHVAHLDPEIAPPVLEAGPPPPLEVRVSETTVSFSRRYPAAPLAAYHAQVLELPTDATHEQLEEGAFVAPGLWVDRWSVTVTGHGERDGVHSFVFAHALTPTSATSTRHIWRVSRNFASSSAATGTLRPLMAHYYDRVHAALEGMQRVLDAEAARGEAHPEVSLTSDAAVTAVRRIVRRLVEDEAVSR